MTTDPSTSVSQATEASPTADDLAQSPAQGFVPASVQAVLAPDEIVILYLRPSLLYIPLSSLGTLAASAVIVSLLAYASKLPASPWTETHAILIATLMASCRLSWAWLDWFTHAFVLTDRRVIARRGIIRTALHEAPPAPCGFHFAPAAEGPFGALPVNALVEPPSRTNSSYCLRLSVSESTSYAC